MKQPEVARHRSPPPRLPVDPLPQRARRGGKRPDVAVQFPARLTGVLEMEHVDDGNQTPASTMTAKGHCPD
jgi:hypothetical protein